MSDYSDADLSKFEESTTASSVEQGVLENNKGKKVLGKTAVLLATGGISNTAWGLAIGLNRLLESKNSDTTLPAIGFALGATAVEYGLTYAATYGDLDMEFHPKRRFTTWVKKHLGKVPFAVTAWRGAASGVAIDQMAGREITQGRRLAHSALYASLLGGWVSSVGSTVLSKGLEVITESPSYAIDHPIPSTIAVISGLGVIARGMQRVEPEVSGPICIQNPQA